MRVVVTWKSGDKSRTMVANYAAAAKLLRSYDMMSGQIVKVSIK